MDKLPHSKLSDYQALAEFRYQVRRYLHVSEQAAREAGTEPQHHQLLLAVKGAPDGHAPRIAYLAERLQIQHHSAVELVDRMEKKGLITRVRGESDRREVLVQLTAEGNRLLAELTQQMRVELRSAAPTLLSALRKLTVRSTQRTSSARKRQKVSAA
jgi:DNA-binding MarR family transcriptional regulator